MGRTKNYETGNEKINDRFVPKIYRYASKGETAKKLDYSRLYYGHICLGNRLILEHIYKDCSNFLDPECGINQDPAFNWFYSDIVRNVNNFIAAHDLENDIISKELLYRTVIKCARDNYVLKSKHNSASCDMNMVYLSLYLHIYLYALIYPNIFADVKLNDMNNNNQSSFLKEHIREIYLAEYLLERAIIFDGFLSVINHNFIEIINNEDSYSINDFLSEKENLNDGKIHELYSANVEFIGKFYHSKYPQKKLLKTKKVLLNHNFFSSLHKGEKNYSV